MIRGAGRARDLLLLALGTTGFTGLAPVAPATVSSAALALLLGLWRPSLAALAILGAAVALASVPVSGWMARRYGADPGACTIDEAAGLLLPLLLHGRGLDAGPAWPLLGAAFLLFRAFDIAKPWPCRRLERLRGGWGIVLDDAMAGVYTWAALEAGVVLLPLDPAGVAPWLRALLPSGP